MAGSPLSWLKREWLSGRLRPTAAMLARWPDLAKRTDSPLQRAARLVARLERTGSELAGPCPLCAGRMIVGKLAWRCLGCGAQEVSGDDQAGLLAAYAAYATMRDDKPEKV